MVSSSSKQAVKEVLGSLKIDGFTVSKGTILKSIKSPTKKSPSLTRNRGK